MIPRPCSCLGYLRQSCELVAEETFSTELCSGSSILYSIAIVESYTIIHGSARHDLHGVEVVSPIRGSSALAFTHSFHQSFGRDIDGGEGWDRGRLNPGKSAHLGWLGIWLLPNSNVMHVQCDAG